MCRDIVDKRTHGVGFCVGVLVCVFVFGPVAFRGFDCVFAEDFSCFLVGDGYGFCVDDEEYCFAGVFSSDAEVVLFAGSA